MFRQLIALFFIANMLGGCHNQSRQADNGAFAPAKETAAEGGYDLPDIVTSGELIVATLSGPDTYFDYQGQPMGLQYALAADFARREGVRVRMEVARDTAQLLDMLSKGEADIAALSIPVTQIEAQGLQAAGASDKNLTVSWAVRGDAPQLVEALQTWYADNPQIAVARQEKTRYEGRRQVKRTVRAPYISREKGLISSYDEKFRQAAAETGWDWRLIAAQCYQESGFDPTAVSWAGARGLMQIMPTTARGLGVSPEQLYSPDVNIRTAARYISKLNEMFSDIRSREERIKFVLAAYNGGPGHVRDAMALAGKYGGNAQRWADVSTYVLRLSEPKYYRDPVVKHGYMIGKETHGYVADVIARWQAYGGTAGGGISGGELPSGARPSRKNNRYSASQRILSPEELGQK